MTSTESYLNDGVALLRRLIATPSTSRDEGRAADVMEQTMKQWGLQPQRELNNVWAVAPGYDDRRPTLLLNAHIDTVRPVASWTRQPFEPTLEGDRLYGLGANDCGGGLVTLLQVFRIMAQEERTYNLIYLASAEEEVSGSNGVARVLPLLPHVSAAIVGEPTGMQPAVAERGLMVIDGYAHGQSGHAARQEGVNAIYLALDDLTALRDYIFERESPMLGPTRAQVTQVEAGTQHNVVPDCLHFVVDVRTNECYTNEEAFGLLQQLMTHCELKARSYRLHSSAIAMGHPLTARCLQLGLQPFGSPTLSDQALMHFPSLKLGPGESSRSHTADEYVCVSEMRNALGTYLQLLRGLELTPY